MNPGAAVLDWLLENRTPLLILFAAAAVVLGIVWWRTRKREYLYGLGGVALLAAVYWLLTLFAGETDPQQIERKLDEMVAGVNERQLDRSFAQVSESFRVGTMDKRGFRQRAEAAVQRFSVRNMRVFDVAVEEVSRENRSATVTFNVKADVSGVAQEAFYRCRMNFVLDPDGEWRMRSFDLFNPVVDTNQPIPLPF